MKNHSKVKLLDTRKAIVSNSAFIFETVRDIVTDLPEKHWDVLFNTTEKPTSHFDFLKNTQVEDIDFDDIKNHPNFLLVNKKTGEKIEASNRISTSAEIRGQCLRDILTHAKVSKKNISAYDAVKYVLRSTSSSCIAYLGRNAIAHHPFGWGMSLSHYTLFTRVLMIIATRRIHRGINPLSNNFWDGVDIGKVFDYTSCVENIKIKSAQLEKQGHKQASIIAMNLYINLSTEIEKLNNPVADISKIHLNCKHLIIQASESELKEHRNIFSKIWYKILSAIKYLSSAPINPKITDSFELLRNVYSTSTSIFYTHQIKPEPYTQTNRPNPTSIQPSSQS